MSTELKNRYPPRIENNQFSFVRKAVATIDGEIPPTAILTKSGIVVAHQVDIAKAQNPTSVLAKYAPLLGYAGLGSKHYLLLKTLTETRAGNDTPLRFAIADKNKDSTIKALHPQLEDIKESIRRAPFATLPIWAALDVATTTITLPFTEVILGTGGTILLSRFVWMRHINNINSKLSRGDIEFTTEEQLAPVQESLLNNDQHTALVRLSEFDTKSQNDQPVLLFTPEVLNVAEMIILSGKTDENILDRALTIVTALANRT